MVANSAFVMFGALRVGVGIWVPLGLYRMFCNTEYFNTFVFQTFSGVKFACFFLQFLQNLLSIIYPVINNISFSYTCF